jgi:hypothetical protein
MRNTAFAALLALAPGLALAQAEDPSAMTCARFSTLAVADQVSALATLEPFGDDMNPGDEAASRAWAATVTAACAGHPDRRLPEAARDAMGE